MKSVFAGRQPRAVALRGVYPSAQHVTIVAFQRILPTQAMVAGELQRQVYRLNGVVGNRDFREIRLNGGKAQLRGLFQQTAIDQ